MRRGVSRASLLMNDTRMPSGDPANRKGHPTTTIRLLLAAVVGRLAVAPLAVAAGTRGAQRLGNLDHLALIFGSADRHAAEVAAPAQSQVAQAGR